MRIPFFVASKVALWSSWLHVALYSDQLKRFRVILMHASRTLFRIGLAVVCLLVFADVADAGYRGRRHHRSHRSGRTGSNIQSVMARAYAEQMRAAAVREAALQAARAETNRATIKLYTTRVRLEKEFRLSPEVKAAESKLKEAQRELEEAHESVIAKLRSRPDYQAASRTKDDANSRVKSLETQPAGSPVLLEAASSLTAAASDVSRIERAAFKSDAAVQAAERRAATALEEVQSSRLQFKASISSNPAIAAASGDVLQARRRMAAAHATGNASQAGAGRGRTNSRGRPGR